MLFRVQSFLVVLVLLTACSPDGGDLREGRDPLIRRARDLKAAADFDGAIRCYSEALDKRGDMAQAHLEVAAIYHQNKSDYISAIYHYQRFNQLNPGSQKTNMVAAEIRRAKMEYAASLPDRPSDAVQTIATMTTERDLLLKRVRDLQGEVDLLKAAAAMRIAQPAGVAPAQPGLVQPPPQPRVAVAAAPTNAPAPRIVYTVKPGDTLAKIAREYFRNPAMANSIFVANRTTMKNERDLRVGQKIVLPPGARADGG